MGGLAQAGLGDNTGKGEHGQAAILELPELHAVDLVLALALEEAERIEAEVTSLTVIVALGNLNQDGPTADLKETGNKEEETHRSLGHKDVMGIIGCGDALGRVDLAREAEGEAEAAVGSNPAEPGHHANTAMLELSLPHPVESRDALFLPLGGLDEAREILGDRGQVERIKADITNHGSVEVDRAGKPGERRRALGLVHHGIPFPLGHSIQRGRGLLDRLRGESGGRTGE
mmetsp:Transcript_26000/g.53200  ORF Transcript_26000/g.53200 Transcript_26000/m.53200 type:complete len:231 (+) Transcript_26000:218-910(+)